MSGKQLRKSTTSRPTNMEIAEALRTLDRLAAKRTLTPAQAHALNTVRGLLRQARAAQKPSRKPNAAAARRGRATTPGRQPLRVTSVVSGGLPTLGKRS